MFATVDPLSPSRRSSKGAGGKGGPERTKAVDEEGAIKVFDALEKSGLGAQESFRRLLLVSAVDVRNPEGPYPDWYGDKEKETSQGMWKAIGSYMKVSAVQFACIMTTARAP